MRAIERLFCDCVWLAWVGILVSKRGARSEERPAMPGNNGEACRCLISDRNVMPGW